MLKTTNSRNLLFITAMCKAAERPHESLRSISPHPPQTLGAQFNRDPIETAPTPLTWASHISASGQSRQGSIVSRYGQPITSGLPVIRELFRSDRVRIYEMTTIRPRIGDVITATSRPL